ncbi:hypothetical protein BDV37DRAFT_253944 [Aspergillus pseudonomiae]|uniref:Uncharacterized protein n=1 Tax=Aspergillus pseudonomiae TaxID=1506151 RepID=A0A5N7D7Q3_9EURO|nr:uncharacterized protein BDV37DRAFT_253944 [Aspergillus pseudonomiae]KAE8401778.1 hypothetical protein BDV37DRAFT_253944 [Aspergillus pseudonomiae]
MRKRDPKFNKAHCFLQQCKGWKAIVRKSLQLHHSQKVPVKVKHREEKQRDSLPARLHCLPLFLFIFTTTNTFT